MRNAKRAIFIITLILAGFTPDCLAENTTGAPGKNQSGVLDLLKKYQAAKPKAADTPTATELLNRYAETQDKLKSFRIVDEAIAEGSSNHPASSGKREYRIFHSDFRYDGNRCSTRLERWLKLDSLPDKPLSREHEAYNYTRYLWDGKSAFSYSRDQRNKLGSLIIDNTPEAKNSFTLARSNVSTMMGILSGDSERIDKILRKAKGVFVREKMENVSGSECYVIEADIKDGRYTLWIDPAHGYNIARAKIRKTKGNLVDGKLLESGFSISSSFKVTRFEQVDGIWLPMEESSEGSSEWPGGYFSKSKGYSKITSVVLNPDHDALGSFVLNDVPNGALVYIEGHKNSRGLIKYTWQNGTVVDENGRVIMDCRPKKPAKNRE